MHDIIAFLKNAVSRKPQAGLQECFIIKDNFVFASDYSLQAGAPIESSINFNVPAAEFETALVRIKNITGLEYDGQKITVKGGRLRASIQCIEGEPPALLVPNETMLPLPAGFMPAVQVAANFVGETGWSSGIQFFGSKVLAFSNTAGVEITVEGLNVEHTCMTPACAAFLLAQQNPPQEFLAARDRFVFRWGDGRWLRSQPFAELASVEMLGRILTDAGSVAPVIITSDFKQAVEDVAALSNGLIKIVPAQITGGVGATQATVDLPIEGLPDGFVSHWKADVLAKMLTCATAWNPAAYPKPSLFTGPNLRGVVLGCVG